MQIPKEMKLTDIQRRTFERLLSDSEPKVRRKVTEIIRNVAQERDRVGIGGLTLSLIARHQGTTKQALLYYFKSMDLLLEATLIFIACEMDEFIRLALARKAPSESEMDVFVRALVGWAHSSRPQARLLGEFRYFAWKNPKWRNLNLAISEYRMTRLWRLTNGAHTATHSEIAAPISDMLLTEVIVRVAMCPDLDVNFLAQAIVRVIKQTLDLEAFSTECASVISSFEFGSISTLIPGRGVIPGE